MRISEVKKKIVIDNYFKTECDINTPIKKAFTKGFELGLKKAPTPQPKVGKWENISDGIEYNWGTCNKCKTRIPMAYKYYEFCPNCGIKMEV